VEPGEHPLAPLLLQLVAKATTVTLTGLGRDQVGALMARTAGREPDPELVAEVHRRTGGNPFFVEQTARLWLADGTVAAVAPGVRDAVGRRLARLPERVVELLGAAAVLGREFDAQVLAACAAVPAAAWTGCSAGRSAPGWSPPPAPAGSRSPTTWSGRPSTTPSA
jgi:predicted ATPase